MNLTPEAVEILRRNHYVANVTEKCVRFTTEFKMAFWERYRQGVSASLVLEQLGVDPALIGESRVASIRQHIKKQAVRMNGFEDRRLNQKHRKANIPKDKRIERLEHELAYTQRGFL